MKVTGMKVAGEEVLDAPVEVIRAVLADVETLAEAIPGCDRLTPAGPGSYLLAMTLAAGPVTGGYSGTATVTPGEDDSSRSVSVRLAGDGGTIGADLVVRLSAAGDAGAGDVGTALSYQADLIVQGQIAAVGRRLLAAAAQRIAADTVAALSGRAQGAGSPGPVVPAEPAAAEPASAEPGPAEPGPAEPAPGGTDGPAGRGLRTRPVARLNAVRERLRTGASTGTWAGVKAGLVAGGAVGLAGIAVGALIGRRRRGAPLPARGRSSRR